MHKVTGVLIYEPPHVYMSSAVFLYTSVPVFYIKNVQFCVHYTEDRDISRIRQRSLKTSFFEDL